MERKRPSRTSMEVFKQRRMRGHSFILLVATPAILACRLFVATSPVNPFKHLEAEILTLTGDWRIPGMSIAVARDGAIVWQRGLGVKNARTGEPLNDGTAFQAASISKSVFAYAALEMCDEGLLDLDTPLVKNAPAEFIEKRLPRAR